MRKPFILALLCIFLFCGCESKGAAAAVNFRSLSFVAEITYMNENYTANCTVDAAGGLTAVLTYPDNLAGFTAVLTDDDCRIEYGGILVGNLDRFPQSAVISLIKRIIDTCDGTEVAVKKKNYTVRGSIDKYQYTLKVSPGGLPISLRIPDIGMAVEFKNVTCI